MKEDGTIISWGRFYSVNEYPRSGIDGIESVLSNGRAFAAIKEDGSLVTWGKADWGGDSSDVQRQLHNVKRVIVGNSSAFAALVDRY